MNAGTKVQQSNKMNLRQLRTSLKYRPKILKLILNMRHLIRKKNKQLRNFINLENKATNTTKTTKNTATQTDEHNSEIIPFQEIIPKNTLNNSGGDENKKMEVDKLIVKCQDSSTQTDSDSKTIKNNAMMEPTVDKMNTDGWSQDDTQEKSIAEQVKEVAQSALQESGMVYVESAGMYYDYKTGYYYNSELGLYYHTETGCYYCYSEDKKNFVFHSYPDRSAENSALAAHQKRKARKHKVEQKPQDDIENLTKNLSQENQDGQATKTKRRKTSKKKEVKKKIGDKDDEAIKVDSESNMSIKEDKKEKLSENGDNLIEKQESDKVDNEDCTKNLELEDGECSGSDSEDTSSDASTVTLTDDESVAKHHPPCMRIIVRETALPKLKVGSLFLITKYGGTVGREGEQHTFLLRDNNVSRNHLDIKYDMDKRVYTATDLGSKNGTILNGARMSESQIVSKDMEIMHGSTIQMGETKLLCHIHPGNDTCGHCEPGLIMEAQEKEKKSAYTRTCSVQRQHQLELARLKNKYAPKPLSIEATPYNDRAQARREQVGSSHHSEKTQTADLDTSIASDNKGFKLLEKMGWSKGEGLGKDNQGNTEPVPLLSNDGLAGLGTTGAVSTPSPAPKKIGGTLGPATLRLASRTKMLQPPAKAFSQIDDEDDE